MNTETPAISQSNFDKSGLLIEFAGFGRGLGALDLQPTKLRKIFDPTKTSLVTHSAGAIKVQ